VGAIWVDVIEERGGDSVTLAGGAAAAPRAGMGAGEVGHEQAEGKEESAGVPWHGGGEEVQEQVLSKLRFEDKHMSDRSDNRCNMNPT